MGLCTSQPTEITLESFLLGKTLGRGGFGRVQAALRLRHRKSKNPHDMVAIKRISKSRLLGLDRQLQQQNQAGAGAPPLPAPDARRSIAESDKTSALMLWMERAVMVAVRSPYAVRLLHAFQSKEELVLVMPCYLGGDVHSQILKAGRLAEEVVRACAAEMLLAIEHIHSLFYVYRDFKPLNLLIDAEGHIAVTDYGLCRPLEAEHDYGIIGRGGTRGYRSPEAAAGVAYDFSCDFYSFGVTLYEMATGRRKVQSLHPNVPNTANDIKTNARLSHEFKDLIRRLTAASPAERLGCELSCKRMVERCERIGAPINRFTSRAPPRSVDRRRMAGAGGAGSSRLGPLGFAGQNHTHPGALAAGAEVCGACTCPLLAAPPATTQQDAATAPSAGSRLQHYGQLNAQHAAGTAPQPFHNHNHNQSLHGAPGSSGSAAAAAGKAPLWSVEDDGMRSPGPDAALSCACECHHSPEAYAAAYARAAHATRTGSPFPGASPLASPLSPPALLPADSTGVYNVMCVPPAQPAPQQWLGHGHVRGKGWIPGVAQVYQLHPAAAVPFTHTDQLTPTADATPAPPVPPSVAAAAEAAGHPGMTAVPVYQALVNAQGELLPPSVRGPAGNLLPAAVPLTVPCGCSVCAGCRCAECLRIVALGQSFAAPEVDALDDLSAQAAYAAAAAGVALNHRAVTTTSVAGPVSVEAVPAFPSGAGLHGSASLYASQYRMLLAHRIQLAQAAAEGTRLPYHALAQPHASASLAPHCVQFPHAQLVFHHGNRPADIDENGQVIVAAHALLAQGAMLPPSNMSVASGRSRGAALLQQQQQHSAGPSSWRGSVASPTSMGGTGSIAGSLAQSLDAPVGAYRNGASTPRHARHPSNGSNSNAAPAANRVGSKLVDGWAMRSLQDIDADNSFHWQAVRNHPWFAGVNWGAVARRESPAPFPPISSKACSTFLHECFPTPDMIRAKAKEKDARQRAAQQAAKAAALAGGAPAPAAPVPGLAPPLSPEGVSDADADGVPPPAMPARLQPLFAEFEYAVAGAAARASVFGGGDASASAPAAASGEGWNGDADHAAALDAGTRMLPGHVLYKALAATRGALRCAAMAYQTGEGDGELFADSASQAYGGGGSPAGSQCGDFVSGSHRDGLRLMPAPVAPQYKLASAAAYAAAAPPASPTAPGASAPTQIPVSVVLPPSAVSNSALLAPPPRAPSAVLRSAGGFSTPAGTPIPAASPTGSAGPSPMPSPGFSPALSRAPSHMIGSHGAATAVGPGVFTLPPIAGATQAPDNGGAGLTPSPAPSHTPRGSGMLPSAPTSAPRVSMLRRTVSANTSNNAAAAAPTMSSSTSAASPMAAPEPSAGVDLPPMVRRSMTVNVQPQQQHPGTPTRGAAAAPDAVVLSVDGQALPPLDANASDATTLALGAAPSVSQPAPALIPQPPQVSPPTSAGAQARFTFALPRQSPSPRPSISITRGATLPVEPVPLGPAPTLAASASSPVPSSMAAHSPALVPGSASGALSARREGLSIQPPAFPDAAILTPHAL